MSYKEPTRTSLRLKPELDQNLRDRSDISVKGIIYVYMFTFLKAFSIFTQIQCLIVS